MEKFQQVWLLLKNLGQTILVFFESILKFIANFYLNIIDYILNFFNLFFQFVANFWKYLNPSLFQNVVLGILIIYVFIAEYVARELKNQKEASILASSITTDEITNLPRILLAVFALIFFSYSFDNRFDNTFEKIVTIIILGIFLFFWLTPIIRFKKIFLEREKLDRKFLENLKFSKIFRFANKTTVLQMEKAWTLVWNSNTEYKEEFTKIFIDHIDSAIKFKKLYFATKLFGIYLNSFDKQTDLLKIAFSILPKILEWDEKFWKEITNQDNSRKKIEDFFSKKYISKFKDFALKLHRKKNRDKDGWWKGYYFRHECLPEIIKKLLKNESYLLFSSFKDHIQKMENKLSKIKNKDYRKNYNTCIHLIFSEFLSTFFNNINPNQESSFLYIQNHDFPNEWKITMKNIEKNKITLLRIVALFIQWSRAKIFQADSDENLTIVINLLFPCVHSKLFTAFLALFFNIEITSAIKKKQNFYFIPLFREEWISTGDDEEDRKLGIAELNKREKEEKEETIQIILNFFRYFDDWRVFARYEEDFTEDEWNNWKNMEENDREKIFTKIKIKKLEKAKIELDSPEMKEICDEEYKRENKKNCLELIELLIENLENKKTV